MDKLNDYLYIPGMWLVTVEPECCCMGNESFSEDGDGQGYCMVCALGRGRCLYVCVMIDPWPFLQKCVSRRSNGHLGMSPHYG